MGEDGGASQDVLHGTTRRLTKVGGSVMITVPKEWLEQHGYKPGDEIPILANRDLVLLSPASNADYYQTGSELVRKSREEAAAANRKKEKEAEETGTGAS